MTKNKIDNLKIGEFEISWLNGGNFALDGGAMFGVVPKVLWEKKYPCDPNNYVPLAARPMLLRTPKNNILIETGIGNKLTDKQKKIFRVNAEWDLVNDLNSLGLAPEDIDYVVLTHYDFDHAGGVVSKDNEGHLGLTFNNALHLLQKSEWEDVLRPNIRSVNTFWPENNEILRDSSNLQLIDGDIKVCEGVELIVTGGHNRGHQIIRFHSEGEVAYHLGDLLPTHAHYNPLWIMAYDNFPLEAIEQKELFEGRARKEDAWLLFYHDPFYAACKFDQKGSVLQSIGTGVL
ncbi:MAG: MBL fold metallo-hydrolase [Nitrospira sp.]|nr:MBL fold metallo-hydrolase [bacterium]MBL7049755.1 MBL fold metallo-hydrolase [Nitrospira sp.]